MIAVNVCRGLRPAYFASARMACSRPPIIVGYMRFPIFIALASPSGSGKSTLFRLLLGFEKPAAGSIYCDSQDLAG